MKKKKKQMSKQCCNVEYEDSDKYFYYIAGYTSNGVPFGITWEQAVAEGLVEIEKTVDDIEDLPF